MSLGKTLKGLFYDESDGKPPTPSPAPTETAPVITNQPAPASAPVAETKKFDEVLQQKMIDAVNAAGIAGYKVLDDMLDSLEDVVPDVNVRYKKALEICAKQGYTPAVLLNDIDKVVGVLEEESRVFEADQKAQFHNSVGALTKSVETLNQQIAEGEQQLQALQQKLVGLRGKRDTDAAAVGAEQALIDHVNSRFTVVYGLIMKEVQDQRAVVAAKVLP